MIGIAVFSPADSSRGGRGAKLAQRLLCGMFAK